MDRLEVVVARQGDPSPEEGLKTPTQTARPARQLTHSMVHLHQGAMDKVLKALGLRHKVKADSIKGEATHPAHSTVHRVRATVRDLTEEVQAGRVDGAGLVVEADPNPHTAHPVREVALTEQAPGSVKHRTVRMARHPQVGFHLMVNQPTSD